MTIEDVLRETFRERETRVADRELVAPVQARVARQNRRRAAGAGIAIVAVLAGGSAVRALDAPAPNGPVVARENTDGWVAVSSRGAQIRVPADWGVNDFGCNMSQAPSVVRAQGVQRLCETPEAPSKEVAILGDSWAAAAPGAVFPDPLAMVTRPAAEQITVSGLPGERKTYRLDDGRYGGSIEVPSRQLILAVRTLDAERTRTILDSLEFVSTDANGCSVSRAGSLQGESLDAARDDALAPPASSVAVCYYGNPAQDVLAASALLRGADAAELLAALNAARRDGLCGGRDVSYAPSVVLVLADPSGRTVRRIAVTLKGCAEAGLYGGGGPATLTLGILKLIMAPLHTGYELPPRLPR